jgi:hypothetical protein
LRQSIRAISSAEPSGEQQNTIAHLAEQLVPHCHRILDCFLEMSQAQAAAELTYTLPAFVYLILSNAAITMTEFPDHLDDTYGTLDKLLQVQAVVEQSGKVDLVLKWAVDVMKRIAMEN